MIPELGWRGGAGGALALFAEICTVLETSLLPPVARDFAAASCLPGPEAWLLPPGAQRRTLWAFALFSEPAAIDRSRVRGAGVPGVGFPARGVRGESVSMLRGRHLREERRGRMRGLFHAAWPPFSSGSGWPWDGSRHVPDAQEEALVHRLRCAGGDGRTCRVASGHRARGASCEAGPHAQARRVATRRRPARG